MASIDSLHAGAAIKQAKCNLACLSRPFRTCHGGGSQRVGPDFVNWTELDELAGCLLEQLQGPTNGKDEKDSIPEL